MKTHTTINKIFDAERNSIVTPSRAEFRDILDRVTKNNLKRNTGQNAVHSFLVQKKTIFVVTAFLVILVVIIPKKVFIHNTQIEYQTVQDTSLVSAETDAIIADIISEMNEENVLLQNEFGAEQNVDDDNDILDTLFIS